MFTAFARCWSAALTPTLRGSTTTHMSRRPPAFRAVTVPALPGSPVTATPTGTSPSATRVAPGGLVDSGTGAEGRAPVGASPCPDVGGISPLQTGGQGWYRDP